MNYNDLDSLTMKDLVIFDKTWSTICGVSICSIPVSLSYVLVSGDFAGFVVAGMGGLMSVTSHQYSTGAKCKIMERNFDKNSIVRRHRKRDNKNSNK